MLLGVGMKIESSVLLDSFMDYISEVDWRVLIEALTIFRAQSLATFPNNLQDNLLTNLAVVKFRCQPEMLVHVAKRVFQSTPMLAINSQVHKEFWASMTPAHLYTLFWCTPSKDKCAIIIR